MACKRRQEHYNFFIDLSLAYGIAYKKDYTMEEYEAKYSEIETLYDLAEELVSTIESKFVSDPVANSKSSSPLSTILATPPTC